MSIHNFIVLKGEYILLVEALMLFQRFLDAIDIANFLCEIYILEQEGVAV